MANDQKRQFKRNKRGGDKRNDQERQFDSVPVSIRRVTKVRSGSKRMRFSVMVVIGDRKGKVGVGLGKGTDVRMSIEKATAVAKQNMINVPLVGTTIPHEITIKRGAAKVFLKPALPGTGVIAGGAVRAVAEMAGVKDLLSKVYGTNNKINNVYATFDALKALSAQRIDGSFKVKAMEGTIKVETLAEKDKKDLARKRAEEKSKDVRGKRSEVRGQRTEKAETKDKGRRTKEAAKAETKDKGRKTKEVAKKTEAEKEVKSKIEDQR